jgi:hypothetical protein
LKRSDRTLIVMRSLPEKYERLLLADCCEASTYGGLDASLEGLVLSSV